MARLAKSSIVDAVTKNLEKDADYFPPEDIEYYIDQCFDILSENSGVIEEQMDQTTVSGTWAYDKPDGLIGIIAVTYDNFDLVKQDKRKILKLINSSQTPETVTGMPNAWYELNIGQIALFPTPSDTKTVTIHYYTYQADLQDADVPVFLRSVNAIAEAYATYMLMAR